MESTMQPESTIQPEFNLSKDIVLHIASMMIPVAKDVLNWCIVTCLVKDPVIKGVSFSEASKRILGEAKDYKRRSNMRRDFKITCSYYESGCKYTMREIVYSEGVYIRTEISKLPKEFRQLAPFIRMGTTNIDYVVDGNDMLNGGFILEQGLEITISGNFIDSKIIGDVFLNIRDNFYILPLDDVTLYGLSYRELISRLKLFVPTKIEKDYLAQRINVL